MTQAEEGVERARMGEGGSALAPLRLVLGLVQGLALYGLYRAEATSTWPATAPQLFGPLLLTALFLPIVVLGGLGRLRVATLLIWTGVAGALLIGMGWHDVTRQAVERLNEPYLTLQPLPFLIAALFILHHLIVPADQERRPIAAFARYFDVAWKAGVQLALSVGFTGALWLLLFLGAGLFGLIGIRAFGDLLREAWFNIPVTTLTFALAVHLTDVRDGLIRGVRSVALMLLSWLLPVIAGLTGAFLLALPFTGLDGLWNQGSATALMLVAAAALIVLINAAYQDGTPETRPPVALRWAAMAGGVLLVPLVGVAAWGLALRIGQHGLTPDRIVAAACVLVGAVHAVGYAWAAASSVRGAWMKPLERTNLLGAVTAAGLILLLFSPVLDPARLSVMDQTARLARGAVTPADFDYAFLRFESGRVGEAALAKLAASSDAKIAKRAKEAQEAEGPYYEVVRSDPRRPKVPEIGAWPTAARLPEAFLAEVDPDDGRWRCGGSSLCLATVMDLDRDGLSEVLMATRTHLLIYELMPDGSYEEAGGYSLGVCDHGRERGYIEMMRAGDLEFVTPRWPTLRTGRVRQTVESVDCPPPTLVGPDDALRWKEPRTSPAGNEVHGKLQNPVD